MVEKGGRSIRISLFQVVVALVVVSAVIIGYLFATLPPRPPDSAETVQEGDAVEVDYIGFFSDGRVFDTSMEAVAKDNATYPKAVSFVFRGFYTPLQFVATRGPEATVIVGMVEGVLGMKEGEAKLVEIPSEKGYGSPDPSLFEVRPLVVELTQFEELTRGDFQSRFRTSPAPGLTVEDPLWKWNVIVTSLSQHFVTIMHVPEQGMTVSPFGSWPARVLEVDSSANGGLGKVVVQHLLGIADVNNVGGEDDKGPFRVTGLDLEAGTYTVDYNREVVGKTLFFEITLLTITRP